MSICLAYTSSWMLPRHIQPHVTRWNTSPCLSSCTFARNSCFALWCHHLTQSPQWDTQWDPSTSPTTPEKTSDHRNAAERYPGLWSRTLVACVEIRGRGSEMLRRHVVVKLSNCQQRRQLWGRYTEQACRQLKLIPFSEVSYLGQRLGWLTSELTVYNLETGPCLAALGFMSMTRLCALRLMEMRDLAVWTQVFFLLIF